MRRTLERAEGNGIALPKLLETDYVNTIPTSAEPAVRRRRGDGAPDHRLEPLERGRDGHPRLPSTASAATSPPSPRPPGCTRPASTTSSRARKADGSGDQLYIQGHASPGIYARAFLDGRLTEQHLDNFRQEAGGNGLPVLPAPAAAALAVGVPDRLDGPRPALGDLPGALQPLPRPTAASRTPPHSHVWAFLGDGEMDEPESTAALALAAREGLDNLTFVINCNLQRLDGPVRANFKIVQELEAQFRGAGWNVVKSLWGTAWDELFQLDTTGALVRRLREVPGRAVPDVRRPATPPTSAQHFFGADPALVEMAKLLSDAKIARVLPHLPRRPRGPQGVRGLPGRRSSTRARRRSSWRRRSRATPSARASSRRTPTTR